ncbi:MAG: Triphosphoribosyl-dephospho-CoA synthase [Rhodospirillales bacterium]|nr:Triphosphoribosyl-dephospho-CoA synthase [Rhodospirillales bacterium]
MHLNLARHSEAPTPAEIERCALDALRGELACYPKPGLVSFVDRGSHADMDASVFLRSIDALTGYFAAIAAAGADGAPFAVLNQLGRDAERRMLEATGGINTHRGAIFALGLLAAAGGDCDLVAMRWGADINAARSAPDSHGSKMRVAHGVAGARSEAANGFPTVRHALAQYRSTLAWTRNRERASVDAFFASMAVLDDTNLLYRGGAEGLAFAQREATWFLRERGDLQRATALHHQFVARNLSPGGSADILAAVLFLHALAA